MRNKKVLLVDDDKDQLQVLELFLSKQKFSVITANGAKEALKTLKQAPVDLVICDLMMPEMSGKDFLQRVRNSERYATLPIIMLTATTEDLELEVLSSGADMFCTKDKIKKDLLSQIKLLLA